MLSLSLLTHCLLKILCLFRGSRKLQVRGWIALELSDSSFTNLALKVKGGRYETVNRDPKVVIYLKRSSSLHHFTSDVIEFDDACFPEQG